MSVIRWCGAASRRMTAGVDQRAAFSSLATSSASPTAAPILCGRGYKKTKKGKRFKGPYRNSRPKKEKQVEKDKIDVPRSTPWPLPLKLI